MCFLHGDFVVVDRHAPPLETRIGRTERLFRLYIKDNATLAFGATTSPRRETLCKFHHVCPGWCIEAVVRIRIFDIADVLACLR